MTENKLETLKAQDLPELNNAFFENVREMLSLTEKTVDPISLRARVILDKLADRLLSLHEKGFSFHEISLFLYRCRIELSANTIKEYFHQTHAKRLLACEQMISDCYKPEWNGAIERTAFIERGLRQALKDERGFRMYYQPQIDMLTGEVLGAEALIRWDFNGILIQPSEFIPVAEGSGLIVPIGEWVLREACHEAKRWQSMGLGGKRGIKIGVNLSVKQFSKGLPDLVHGILCDTGLPTNLLELEITESFLVGNGSLAVLHVLRDGGIHLSIDDFGTGYSCLAQLKDLPLDTIKIDRAFVKDLGQGGSSSAVVEAIIDLARKLKMKTVAEGVETVDQAAALMKMGCSVCQGFLYSKPIPGDEFVRFAGESAKEGFHAITSQ